MRNSLVRISVSAITLFGLAASGLPAATCFPSGADQSLVPFSMVTLKNFSWGSQYASFVKGTMTLFNSKANGLYSSGVTLNSGPAQQLFSDRAFSLGYGLDQPFGIIYPDTIYLTASNVKSNYIRSIYDDPAGGSVTVGSTIIGLSCNAATGELYGAVGTDTFVVITFGSPQPRLPTPY